MKHLHKQIIALLLLLVAAVPLFFSLKFVVQEELIQQSVEEKMKLKTLQTITVAKAEIVWVKAGKEILLDEKFFDVKQFQIKDGMVTLTGYFDTEEDDLVSSYKKQTEKNNQDNPFNNSVIKFLFSTDYTSYKELLLEKHWQLVSIAWPLFEEKLSLHTKQPLIQPPNI